MSTVNALSGGVFTAVDGADDDAELHGLVNDIAKRAYDRRVGRRRIPDEFDNVLWSDLETSGLARLTSSKEFGAGATQSAVVLSALGRHAASIPAAETDLLACWLAERADIDIPASGALTVGIAHDTDPAGQPTVTVANVPWARACAAIVVLATTPTQCRVCVVDPAAAEIEHGHNLAGEPRDRVRLDVAPQSWRAVEPVVATELAQRGAWGRMCQTVGALDAVAVSTIAHTTGRTQFGRALTKFQSVQHALATMAGQIERARVTATLAVAAVADYGFGSAQADYAVTLAKVTLGRCVGPVTAIAHQLHGAIGATAEHHLWLSTMRAQSWITEFGSTAEHAMRIGRAAMRAPEQWDLLIGSELNGWHSATR